MIEIMPVTVLFIVPNRIETTNDEWRMEQQIVR